MPLIQCNYFAESLGLSVTMNVILPVTGFNHAKQNGSLGSHQKFPVLYLLHGLSDDHTMWQRATSIERYVSVLNLAVVMPTVYRGFYTDMKHGHAYWTFISEELPHIAESLFPVSGRREDRFAAGLSMGGYGAFKLGLRNPGRFAAVASLSGALDISSLADEGRPMGQAEYGHIFGSRRRPRGASMICLHWPSSSSRAVKQFLSCSSVAVRKTFCMRTISVFWLMPAIWILI